MDRLQDRRVWSIGGALAAVLVLAVGWLMFIGPELSSTSALRSQTATTQQQNSLLGIKVSGLRAKSKNVHKYTAALARALEALPPSSGLPGFTREVSSHAAVTGVRITSITVGGVTAATTPSPASTPTATPTAAAPTASAAPSAAATGTTGGGGLLTISVSLQSTGPLANQLAFLGRLRTVGPRSVLITSTQFAPAGSLKGASIDKSATMTTALSVFSAPQSPAQMAQLQKLLSGKIGS